jgi:hypothetical protein
MCFLVVSVNAQYYHIGDSVNYPGTTRVVVVDKILVGIDNAHFIYADSIQNPPPFDAIVLFDDMSYISSISPVSISNFQEISPATTLTGPTVPPSALVMNPFYSGMPVVVYSQRVYRGMTYFIFAQTGHGNFPGGIATINLTLDSLAIVNLKKQINAP